MQIIINRIAVVVDNRRLINRIKVTSHSQTGLCLRLTVVIVGNCRHYYSHQHCRLHNLDTIPYRSPNSDVGHLMSRLPIHHALLTCISFVAIDTYWDRTSRVIILLVDTGLNYYFLRTVKRRLVTYHGLTKYTPLVSFNARLIVVSISMDVSVQYTARLYGVSTFEGEMTDSFTAYVNLPYVASKPGSIHAIPSRRLHGEAQHRNIHGQPHP
jgi:hypothetical protein